MKAYTVPFTCVFNLHCWFFFVPKLYLNYFSISKIYDYSQFRLFLYLLFLYILAS